MAVDTRGPIREMFHSFPFTLKICSSLQRYDNNYRLPSAIKRPADIDIDWVGIPPSMFNCNWSAVCVRGGGAKALVKH
jgi:hypothetical protein